MSGTGPRENVFATRQALTNIKSRLKSAQNGHSLLAKKRDALMIRFRAVLKRVEEAKLKTGKILQLASFSLAELTYSTGSGSSLAYMVQEQARKATFTVKARSENVSGVVIPGFESVRGEGNGRCSRLLSFTHFICPA